MTKPTYSCVLGYTEQSHEEVHLQLDLSTITQYTEISLRSPLTLKTGLVYSVHRYLLTKPTYNCRLVYSHTVHINLMTRPLFRRMTNCGFQDVFT